MNILVPVDGTEHSLRAVEFLTTRTDLLGAAPKITIFFSQHPVPQRMITSLEPLTIKDYYAEEAESLFASVRALLGDTKLNIEMHYAVGSPAEEIVKEADLVDADLIIMGIRGHSAVSSFLFGSVSNGVLAKSKCPVLMLRDKAAPQSDALKVGIAVDGSKYGRAAVRYALKHISLFGTGAQFYLINVVSDYAGAVMPDMAGMALPALSEEEVLELQKDEFNEAVEPLRPLFAKAAVATKEICLVGNAGDEIAAFAKKKKLDLVVMGSHGYGRFKAAVMGSTATRIAATGDVPLLIIRQA